MMRKTFVALSIVFLLVVIPGCFYSLFFWSPEPRWDQSPDALIISVVPMYQEIDYNYIPDFRVWGDGRIVWVEHLAIGGRKVYEGYLSHDEMEQIIVDFIDADFFKGYELFNNKDYAFDHLDINLLDVARSELIDRENEEVFALVNLLKQGAGVNVVQYSPERATLYAISLDETGLPKGLIPQYVWPDDQFGYTLSPELVREITSNDLLFAWEIVNSTHPIVESNSEYFWIAITIPGITYLD